MPSRHTTADNKKHKAPWQKALMVAVFILINVIVIALAAASEFGNAADAAELSEVHINFWLLLPAIFCFVAAMILEIAKYALMVRKMSSATSFKAHHGWQIARRTVLLGRYYDNITPAAVGGQPFQIYYMHKNSGLPSGVASAIPIFGMISGQIAFMIIAIFCFLFGGIADNNPALFITAWVGLAFYAFWPIMVAGINFFPKSTIKLVQWVVKILAKIKIIKHREKTLKKVEDELNEYAKSVKLILRTRGLFAEVVAISLIFHVLMATIPFFVLTAFGGDVGLTECFVLTIAVMSAVYFIPTPGNSGAAEGTFFMVFSALSTGYVFWAMLVWRFFSYYSYIIMGLVIYFKLQIEGKKENANHSS